MPEPHRDAAPHAPHRTAEQSGTHTLWGQTMEAHRRGVRDAILDAAAALATQHGLRGVTMSQIAEEAGIGRATLYKYFPNVEAILLAWHERQVAAHLEQLAALRDREGDAVERLAAVLETYAGIVHQRHGTDVAAMLHREEHVADAERRLHEFLRGLIAEGVAAGRLRDDAPPAELAEYCLHALSAAGHLASPAAARRLAIVTLDGLRADRRPAGR